MFDIQKVIIYTVSGVRSGELRFLKGNLACMDSDLIIARPHS